MLAHDLTNPLNLVTVHWHLGLGLFLLGFFLNLLFFLSGRLAVSMGAHAGLVFVKVFLRRIPLVSYAAVVPWWFDPDLRQSPAVHALFIVSIIIITIMHWQKLTHSK